MNARISHLTHYKKIKLSKDVSLRYFFSFEDKPQLVGKWVIKSHSTKKYGILDERTAELIADSHNTHLGNYKEIIGRYISNGVDAPIYRKVLIKGNKVKILKAEPHTDMKAR